MSVVVDAGTLWGATVALLPEVLLSVWGCAIVLFAGWRRSGPEQQHRAGQLTLVALASALVAVIAMWVMGVRGNGTPQMVASDPFRYATAAIFIVGAFLATMMAQGYLGRERINTPEYHGLVILATVGMMLMGAASDLVLVFVALELMSVCVYVLVGINRRSAHAAEGALKYFLLGAFASGFLLYGIALVYGATGSTNLTLIDRQIGIVGVTPMLLIGVGLLLVGFGFKVAAVPFHMWTPDVYDAAPTPVTAFMAAAVKAAGFAALVRLLVHALGDTHVVWSQVLWWLAVLTMVGGNLMALAQRSIKRMLAYSSIGHAGYLLTATASGTINGAGAFLFYAFAYTLMTVGAFAVVAALGRNGERDLLVDDFAGLGTARPWLAFAMAVFMLALLGFPGTAGFIGKWLVLSSAVEANQWILAVVLVLASVVSAGYYLPVIMQMYMRPADNTAIADGGVLLLPGRTLIGGAAVALLLLGVWPGPAIDVAAQASEDLVPAVELTMGDQE
jgi:NADH-quinone oxidoreductase subunit N